MYDFARVKIIWTLVMVRRVVRNYFRAKKGRKKAKLIDISISNRVISKDLFNGLQTGLGTDKL